MRKGYPSDLIDEEWEILEPLIPPAKPGGRRRKTDMREVVNALLYLERSGCQWDMLPHDLLPKSTVYEYFSQWRDDGTWQRLMDALREQVRTKTPKPKPAPAAAEEATANPVPSEEPALAEPPHGATTSQLSGSLVQLLPPDHQPEPMVSAGISPPLSPPAGTPCETVAIQVEDGSAASNEGERGCQSEPECREATPSLVIIDSQSAKTTEVGGAERGYDGGKKVKGRKRHIVVDSLGMLVAVLVTSAAVDDGVAAPLVMGQLTQDQFPRLAKVLGDNKYHNHAFIRWLREQSAGKWELEVKLRPKGSKGFVLLKQRWVVERTFAWLGRSRRLAKDYERLPSSSEAHCKISMIRLMLKRLKPAA